MIPEKEVVMRPSTPLALETVGLLSFFTLTQLVKIPVCVQQHVGYLTRREAEAFVLENKQAIVFADIVEELTHGSYSFKY